MPTKPLILIDADVLIHLWHADKLTLLNQLYPGRLRMLDIVYGELGSNRSINQYLAAVFAFSGIEVIDFPKTGAPEMRTEYIVLKKQIDGKGERATLVYCKHNADIIASSNTKDILPYCTQHGMAFLTTLDIFCVAESKGLITKAEVNTCIAQIKAKGSHVCCNTIEQHLGRHFNPDKLNY